MEMINKEKLQLGICLISCIKDEKWHAHALIIGRKRDGKTLDDCNRGYWVDHWPYFAKIRNVFNSVGAASYLARNFLPSKSDFAEIDIFNSKLLRRVKGKKGI